METTLELINELTRDEKKMWVVGGGPVVSENNSNGIKEPQVGGGYITIEADNWHFHLGLEEANGIQFVAAESHGGLKSYYVRFSKDWDETLVRCYFPNPYLDDNHQRTEFQEDRYRAFIEMRDRYVGREEGIVYVERSSQAAG